MFSDLRVAADSPALAEFIRRSGAIWRTWSGACLMA